MKTSEIDCHHGVLQAVALELYHMKNPKYSENFWNITILRSTDLTYTSEKLSFFHYVTDARQQNFFLSLRFISLQPGVAFQYLLKTLENL